MNLVFEKLAQLLAAGQVWRLNIAADFVRIADAASPVKVRILKAGRILGEMDGWQAGDYLRGVEFDGIEVENGANAQAVTVQIAGGGVGSDRVIGEVSIIDGERKITIANKAFAITDNTQAGAGNFFAVQLWNPAGSGKYAEVNRVICGSSLAAAISLCHSTEGLANISAEKPVNKKSAGENSVMQKRSEVSVTDFHLSAKNKGAFTAIRLQASETKEVVFKEPVILEPGNGLFVAVRIAASTLTTTIDFKEVEI